MVANRELAKKLNINSDNLTLIDSYHELIDNCINRMKNNEVESDEFQLALDEWRRIQGHLQYLWGLPQNSLKWCEYKLPKCTCPKMDNDETGEHTYINCDCPIHGDKNK